MILGASAQKLVLGSPGRQGPPPLPGVAPARSRDSPACSGAVRGPVSAVALAPRRLEGGVPVPEPLLPCPRRWRTVPSRPSSPRTSAWSSTPETPSCPPHAPSETCLAAGACGPRRGELLEWSPRDPTAWDAGARADESPACLLLDGPLLSALLLTLMLGLLAARGHVWDTNGMLGSHTVPHHQVTFPAATGVWANRAPLLHMGEEG